MTLWREEEGRKEVGRRRRRDRGGRKEGREGEGRKKDAHSTKAKKRWPYLSCPSAIMAMLSPKMSASSME